MGKCQNGGLTGPSARARKPLSLADFLNDLTGGDDSLAEAAVQSLFELV